MNATPALWRDVRVADLATLLNALLGLTAILFAATGRPVLAAELVMAGIIVDGIDGALARIGLGGGPLGGILDTLADVVTFGVAPAVVLVTATTFHPLLATAAGLYLCGVLLRLARFEAMRTTGPSDTRHFMGLSSPGAGLLVVTAVLLDAHPFATVAVALLATTLMLTRFPMPKLRGSLGIVAVLLILAVLAGHARTWQPWAAALMLAFLAVYVLAGPLYVKARLRRPSPETP